MRFRVLGPVQVRHNGRWSRIAAAQPRLVVAVLLAEAGRVVSIDRLIDELWGDNPPRTALNTIQGYVARLRKLLGGEPSTRLLTRERGYLLEVADGELDSHLFERLVESGQRSMAGGAVSTGASQLAEALALWQGPAMQDVPASPTATAEANRLEQRRLTALQARFGAQLALGRHAETVDQLRLLVDDFPLHEQFRGQLMLAMYRSGRRAEALEVYRKGRAVLVAELGVEPGPELRDLERAILADDPDLAGALATRITPAQLPADVVGFVSRESLLGELDGLLPARGAAAGIVTITGTPGIGKTALAVHWAHRVRDRFADGQLYVDLRGYASGPPVRPIDALARFLHALGVPADQVPADTEEAAALYRSVLADRRMLVLLDNANHPDQVRPLVPGAPGCLVVVTSRDDLTGLVARDGARRLTLDVLGTPEAVALLARLLGADRVRAGDPAVAELAELCAGLPLALRITAANLAAAPHLSIADHCAQLRTGNRLAGLQVEGDDQTAVRAAFDLSYATLPEPERRLFRLLGLVPGADITAEAAAALAATTARSANRLLARLAAAHLIDRQPAGRYGCHDLLRLYAKDRGEQEDPEPRRQAAVCRLYAWYLRTVDAAATLLYPQLRRLSLPRADTDQPPDVFADNAQALAWLDAERPSLVAAICHETRYRPSRVVGLLAEALRGYFWLRMYTVDWLAVARAGLAAAERHGDLAGQTAALLSLAEVNYHQGHHRHAIEFSTRALATARRTGWLKGEAAALNNLGNLHTEAGRLAEAAEYHRTALLLNTRAGRVDSQVNNLCNLGRVHLHRGDLDKALATSTRALALNRKIDSTLGEAVSLSNLGAVLRELGRLADAVDHLRLALAKHREIGDRGTEVDTRDKLAATCLDAGDHAAAHAHAHGALILAREVGYRYGEADALNTLGFVHMRLGNSAAAADHHRQALALARDIVYRYGETTALVGLALASRSPEDARQALELAGEIGYRVLAARAATVLAGIHLDRGELAEAADLAERALAGHRRTGHRLGTVAALSVLGDLAGRTGDHVRARSARAEATALRAELTAARPGRRPPDGGEPADASAEPAPDLEQAGPAG